MQRQIRYHRTCIKSLFQTRMYLSDTNPTPSFQSSCSSESTHEHRQYRNYHVAVQKWIIAVEFWETRLKQRIWDEYRTIVRRQSIQYLLQGTKNISLSQSPMTLPSSRTAATTLKKKTSTTKWKSRPGSIISSTKPPLSRRHHQGQSWIHPCITRENLEWKNQRVDHEERQSSPRIRKNPNRKSDSRSTTVPRSRPSPDEMLSRWRSQSITRGFLAWKRYYRKKQNEKKAIILWYIHLMQRMMTQWQSASPVTIHS